VASHANVDNEKEAFMALLERYEETHQLGPSAAELDDDDEWAVDV
jgi:hypothetical protein